MPVTYADVEAAAATIRGAVVRTPSSVSETLSEILGCAVVVKFEIFQFTASFKERGARNRLASLTPAERANGIVAVSAGNHAQAVAYHAGLLGIPATIVMPATTPFVKVARTKHLGADVELHGSDLSEAIDHAQRFVAEGRTLIHPYDDRLVIAGQGTVALELLDDHPDLDCIVVPVGGGGLIAGMAVAVATRAPEVELIGIQSETYPSMARALANDDRAVGGPTMAEGIAVVQPGTLTEPIVRVLVTDVLVVSEHAIEEAVNVLLEVEKVVVEGAGGTGIAALCEHRERFAGRRVGVVLTGANIDPRVLSSIIDRGLARAGRLARVRVELDDRPGALAALLTVVGAAGANLLEVHHQRVFADVPLRSADVDLVMESLDQAHRDEVLTALGAAGYVVRLLPLDTA